MGQVERGGPEPVAAPLDLASPYRDTSSLVYVIPAAGSRATEVQVLLVPVQSDYWAGVMVWVRCPGVVQVRLPGVG
jgi:hypothetical protein